MQLQKLLRMGLFLRVLEMMDEFAIKASEDFARPGYPLQSKALLLCELDGSEEFVNIDIDKVLSLLSKAQSVRVSESEEERLLLWKGRKSAFPAVGRLSPDYYCMDGTIPKRHLADVLEKINESLKIFQPQSCKCFSCRRW